VDCKVTLGLPCPRPGWGEPTACPAICLDARAGRVRRPPPARSARGLVRASVRHVAASSGYVGRVLVGGVLLIACGIALAWPTLRVIRAPRDRWIQGRSQWLLFMWARRGEAPPSASELRLWASIWLGVATIFLGLGVALIASA
jgi:hypothetical protein